MEISLAVQILLMALLLTFLWLQMLRILVWAMKRLMEWMKSGDERESILRLLRRILLDPL